MSFCIVVTEDGNTTPDDRLLPKIRELGIDRKPRVPIVLNPAHSRVEQVAQILACAHYFSKVSEGPHFLMVKHSDALLLVNILREKWDHDKYPLDFLC